MPSVASRGLGEQTVRFWYKGKKLRRRAEVQCSLEEFIERWIQHIPEHYQHAVRWLAAHVQDVAHLYRLALEKHEGEVGTTRSLKRG